MKKAIAGVFFLLALGIYTSSWATVDTRPLKAFPGVAGGSGSFTLTDEDIAREEMALVVDAEGLQPNSVYSVWLAKRPSEDRDMRGVSEIRGLGVKDHYFVTDGDGKGRFFATLTQADLSRWDIVEVAHHPDGNPKNIQNTSIVLTGDLP